MKYWKRVAIASSLAFSFAAPSVFAGECYHNVAVVNMSGRPTISVGRSINPPGPMSDQLYLQPKTAGALTVITQAPGAVTELRASRALSPGMVIEPSCASTFQPSGCPAPGSSTLSAIVTVENDMAGGLTCTGVAF